PLAMIQYPRTDKAQNFIDQLCNYVLRTAHRIDGVKESNKVGTLLRVGHEVMADTPVPVLRSVKYILQRLCQTAVKVRRSFEDAEQRGDIETICSQRSGCRSDVGKIRSNLIRTAAAECECADV